jgi:hypothetical protein
MRANDIRDLQIDIPIGIRVVVEVDREAAIQRVALEFCAVRHGGN